LIFEISKVVRTLIFFETKYKKRKKVYELNHKFQDVWATKLPWAKNVLNEDGLITHVPCKICTKVMVKENLFVPKFDYLCKHVYRKKVTSPMFSVPTGTFYYDKNCQHVKNEMLIILEMRKMCWTRLCKVWDIRACHSICHNFLPTPRGKTKV
jgi:hypothetical protein